MGAPSINIPASIYELDTGVSNAMNPPLLTTEPLAITVIPSYSYRPPFPDPPISEDTVPFMAAHQSPNLSISNYAGSPHSGRHEQDIMINATVMTEARNVQEDSVKNSELIGMSISPGPVTVQFTSADPTSPIAIADSPQKRPHLCPWPKCHKAFTRSAHLVRHTRSHGDEKPYACVYVGCGKQFSRSDVLKEHIRTHDTNKVRKRKARMPTGLTKDSAVKKPNLTITTSSTTAVGPYMSSPLLAKRHRIYDRIGSQPCLTIPLSQLVNGTQMYGCASRQPTRQSYSTHSPMQHPVCRQLSQTALYVHEMNEAISLSTHPSSSFPAVDMAENADGSDPWQMTVQDAPSQTLASLRELDQKNGYLYQTGHQRRSESVYPCINVRSTSPTLSTTDNEASDSDGLVFTPILSDCRSLH